MHQLYSTNIENGPAIHGIAIRNPANGNAQSSSRVASRPAESRMDVPVSSDGDPSFSALIWFVRLMRE
jgi:hypothetical protein